MPIFSYFLIVGSVLTGLLFYADSVMDPSSLPFSVSQRIGLPKPYETPVVADVPKPEITAAIVEPPVEVKKLIKAGRKRQSARIVRHSVRQQRYATYPEREYGSIW
ncbi:MAG TPA: hypothetical protein VLQ90_03050 [Pyrinomonadaceae bacterium]|nr:hypothetical protein [Pyrinomonadaceae bacterium]